MRGYIGGIRSQIQRGIRSQIQRDRRRDRQRGIRSQIQRDRKGGGIFSLFRENFTKYENEQLAVHFNSYVLNQITDKDKRQIINYMNEYNELKNKISLNVRNKCTGHKKTEFEDRIMRIDKDRIFAKSGFEEVREAYRKANKWLNTILEDIPYDCKSTQQ